METAPARSAPDRDDDMTATASAMTFVVDYEVGYLMNSGKIQAAGRRLCAAAGFSSDLSGPVTDRALFHADKPIGIRRCGCARSRFIPTRYRTRPFVASAARRACWRPSADRRYRLCAGQGSARYPQGQFSTARPAINVTALPPDGGGQHIHRVVDELEASSDYQRDARRFSNQYNAGARSSRRALP